MAPDPNDSIATLDYKPEDKDDSITSPHLVISINQLTNELCFASI